MGLVGTQTGKWTHPGGLAFQVEVEQALDEIA